MGAAAGVPQPRGPARSTRRSSASCRGVAALGRSGSMQADTHSAHRGPAPSARGSTTNAGASSLDSPRTASHCPERACKTTARTRNGWPTPHSADGPCGRDRATTPTLRSSGCPTTPRGVCSRNARTREPSLPEWLPHARSATRAQTDSSSTTTPESRLKPHDAPRENRRRSARSRPPAAGPDHGTTE